METIWRVKWSSSKTSYFFSNFAFRCNRADPYVQTMGVLLVVSIIVCASCFLITDRWCLQRKVHELYLGSRCNFTYVGKTKKDRHAALKIERKHVFQRKNPF